MLEVSNLTVALPTALLIAANGEKALSHTGVIPFLIVSLLGMSVSTWLLHRIHAYARKLSVKNYVELAKTFNEAGEEKPMVSVLCIMLLMLPLIQFIIHLALNQVELERWPKFGVKGAVALVLIAFTAIPYAIKAVPFMAIAGWIFLLVAGVLSWTPNSDIKLIPTHFNTTVVHSLTGQFLRVTLFSSPFTIIGYETKEIYLLSINLVLQMMAVAFPILFGATKFKIPSLYLTIPICLASLFLLAHHFYQRDLDAKDRASLSLRYGLPMGVLALCSLLLVSPFAQETPLLLSLDLMDLTIFIIGPIAILTLLRKILQKEGEMLKFYIALTGLLILYIVSFLTGPYINFK